MDHGRARFLGHIVHCGQDAEAATVSELIPDEIHGPAGVGHAAGHQRRRRSDGLFAAATPAPRQAVRAAVSGALNPGVGSGQPASKNGVAAMLDGIVTPILRRIEGARAS